MALHQYDLAYDWIQLAAFALGASVGLAKCVYCRGQLAEITLVGLLIVLTGCEMVVNFINLEKCTLLCVLNMESITSILAQLQ
jgi:hypothetical protein